MFGGQQSSSSRTTVTRTTHTSSSHDAAPHTTTYVGGSPFLGHPLLQPASIQPGTTVSHLPGGVTQTTTQYMTHGGMVPMVTTSSGMPMITQTRYVNAAPSTQVWASMPQVVQPQITSKGFHLGKLSMAPFRPVYQQAQMGIVSGEQAQRIDQTATSAVTYSNTSSLILNNVECAGHIAISTGRIVQAKNLFVGVAPFVLSPETLEVTPEMTVVARNPDIKVHIADLPTAELPHLTLPQLREMVGGSESVYIGLPGQPAGLVVEEAGVMKVLVPNEPTGVLLRPAGFIL